METKRIKIFLGLKVKEIWKVIRDISIVAILISVVIFIIYGLVFLISLLPFDWALIEKIIICICGVIVGIFAIIVLTHEISTWLKSNWKKAGELAKIQEV